MYCRSVILSHVFFACLAGINDAHAQSQDYDIRPDAAQVTGEALIAAFSGVTHEGAYNFDARGRPGMWFTERHYTDGRISYKEDGQTINGQWAIMPRDTICYVYDSETLNGGCYRIYKLGSCYYYYLSGVVPLKHELTQNYWTARSVKQGERASCEDMIS